MNSLGEAIVTSVMVGATAVTGGVTANSNQTTVTGDSSASVQVTNTINSNDSGGTSHTVIEKTVDGVTTREEKTQDYAPGEPIEVNVEAHAESGGQTTQGSSGTSTESDTEDTGAESESNVEASTTVDVASSTIEASSTASFVQSIGSYIAQTISNIFSGLRSLWN